MDAARLVAWRLRLAVAALRGRGRGGRRLELVVGGSVATSLLLLSWAWTRALAAAPETASWAPLALFAALHATFVLSLMRDTAAALGHLFVSPDVPLLLAAPFGARPLVALKGLEAIGDAAAFPVTVALPVLLGYGLAVGAPPAYFVAAPLVLALLLCLTVGAGFVLALLLAPVVPAGRVRQWLRLAVTGLSLAAWLGLVWLNAAPGGRGWEEIGASGAALASGPAAGAPSGWAASALLAVAGTGAGSPAVPLGQLVAAVLAAVAVLFAAARGFPLAWQRSQVLDRRVRRERRPSPRTAGPPVLAGVARAARTAPGARAGLALAPAFARRDARLVGRDPNLLWDMGLLLIMSSVLPLAVVPMLGQRAGWVALPALFFFAAELGYDLGSRAFPLERQAWTWVFAAPLSPRAILAARGAAAWGFGMVLVGAAGAAAWIGLHLSGRAAPAALAVAWALFSITLPAGLAAGLYLGRADWRHPRQMLDLGGRLLLIAILLVLSFGLVVSLSAAEGGRALSVDARSALAWGAGTGLAVVVAALWLALRRLRRFEGLN